MTTKPLQLFRAVAIIEGCTFLFLLGVAMPMKYAAGHPEWVMVAGMVHGIAWIVYCALGLYVRAKYQWSAVRSVLAFVAGVLPFGPFVFDRTLRRDEEAVRRAPEPAAAA